MSDIRSRKCVFVSHCILAQCVRAEGLARYFPGPVRPVVEFCLNHDINMMQMPCPETLCAAGGLGREPHGKGWYEKHGLRETAQSIAKGQALYMRTVTDAGNQILAVIGMEFSPACAVNLLNRGQRIVRGEGIFVEELRRELAQVGLSPRFIGVNQRGLTKLAAELAELVGTTGAAAGTAPERSKAAPDEGDSAQLSFLDTLDAPRRTKGNA